MKNHHRNAAWNLIDRYQLHAGSLPVSLAPLTDEFPALARDLSAIGVYGLLVPPATVVLHAGLTADESRLVYAHEIGHALLGHDGTLKSLAVDTWFHTKAERDAWLIAAMLLIPDSAIRWNWTVRQIAASCRVPDELVHQWSVSSSFS